MGQIACTWHPLSSSLGKSAGFIVIRGSTVRQAHPGPDMRLCGTWWHDSQVHHASHHNATVTTHFDLLHENKTGQFSSQHFFSSENRIILTFPFYYNFDQLSDQITIEDRQFLMTRLTGIEWAVTMFIDGVCNTTELLSIIQTAILECQEKINHLQDQINTPVTR